MLKILRPSLGSTLDLITYKLNISLYICSAKITLSLSMIPFSSNPFRNQSGYQRAHLLQLVKEV